ncbi:hypothetical protein YTPLAS18_20810 [Nitrospira sp.]|nr:hypothetical protein YTPLAS18_20810 [Nitrospira sp.]
MPASDLQEALADHLFHWGLRPFLSDREYERFQRDHLRPADLHQLRLLSEARQGGTAPGEADLAFYEYAAQPHIYPTLYSQRFDYYLTVGTAVAERLGQARRILDVGCGLGILTTFYARQAPEARVVGIDRSARSIEVARGQAAKLGLKQCTFTCHDLDHDPIGEPYDLIIASQALVQSERDPGLPSESWQTYARSRHNDYQRDFEQRTGIGHRLDHLRNALSQEGRALFCEKAHHLGRRVGFQRALAARGWHPVAPPAPIRYLSIEEVTDDGPLYELSPHAEHPPALDWDESPERMPDDAIFAHSGPTAEFVWDRLPLREPIRRTSFKPPGLASGTIEWGDAGPLAYVYVTRHNGFRGLQVGPRSPSGLIQSTLAQALLDAGADGTRVVELLAQSFRDNDSSLPPADALLYENHCAAAQDMYFSLMGRTPREERDQSRPDGRQLHIELGRTTEFAYLYCANTYDQRQIVLVEPARRHLVEQYYQELIG